MKDDDVFITKTLRMVLLKPNRSKHVNSTQKKMPAYTQYRDELDEFVTVR